MQKRRFRKLRTDICSYLIMAKLICGQSSITLTKRRKYNNTVLLQKPNIVQSLVKEHHKRRTRMLGIAKAVQALIGELPKDKKKEMEMLVYFTLVLFARISQ